MKKTIGFCGCSFTEGFALENQESERYSYLVAKTFHSNSINYAKAGGSNNEIFLQAIQSLNENEITIVQWTSPGRARFYHYAGYLSWTRDTNCAHPYIPPNKYKIFCEVYSLIDSWYNQYQFISKCVPLLNATAFNLNKKVFYINGLLYIDPVFLNNVNIKNFYELAPVTKQILNFDNFQDEDILLNLKTIRDFFKVVDDKWINTYVNLNDLKIDLATDDSHPGPLSQIKYAEMITNFFINRKIITK